MTVFSTSKPHKLGEKASSSNTMQKGVCIVTRTHAGTYSVWYKVPQTETTDMLY